MPITHDVEQHLTGHFKHGACTSICANLSSCCFFYCCTPCAIYSQRKDILNVTGEPYVCCGGTWPCCGCDKPRSSTACLVCEVCCFPNMALAGNHFLVQTRFNKRNSTLDSMCKIGNLCVSCEFCLLRICCDCSKEAENLVKGGTCICPCAHCQNAGELDEFSSGRVRYNGPPEGVVTELPNHFANVGRGPATAPVQMKPM